MVLFSSEMLKIGLLNFTRQHLRRLKILSALGLILFILGAIPSHGLCAKRVGIVYSETSANQFYDKFSYSQLFMAMQHQAMMAGIPFDVLSESDLTDSANLLGYSALIIPSMAYAENEAAITNALQSVSENGVGIITSGILLSDTATADILGVAYVGGAYGVAATVTAADISHPVMHDYTANELMVEYSQIWFDGYQPVNGQAAAILARINTNSGTYSGVIATVKGGRNVHFANGQIIGDSNLVWSALKWVVFGGETPVGLELSRNRSIFLGRNDMDSSMYADELDLTEIPLLDLLTAWKQSYNFVGSFYLNIGNNPQDDEYTDWQISGPLYQDYIALGNEIGTHSYTHPDYTSQLTSNQLEFEFNQSKLEIGNQLGIDVVGAAIPGNPESIEVDRQLNDYFEYVSGRSSVIGAGYPGAIGFLTPDYDMLYFSLNLSPDYTLIEYLGYTPEEAIQIWRNEFNGILRHASLPIIHWLWHDYGPTEEQFGPYSLAMYEDTIAMAYNAGSEFATVADIQNRIRAFQSASLDVDGTDTLSVNVAAADVGQFSLKIKSDQIITGVDDWYAYDQDQVFIPQNGGRFIIHQGAVQNELTHITSLPMRAKLISVSGNGSELTFTFEGEGKVVVELNPEIASNLNLQGADGTTLSGTTLEIYFNQFGEHTADISYASAVNHAPVADAQTLATPESIAIAVTLTGSDQDGDPLTFQVTSNPSHGTLSGTAPNLTYTPAAGFSGSDGFGFVANDGLLDSTPATIGITVTGNNQMPVAESQALTVSENSVLAVILTGSDPDGDALTFQVTSNPSHGTLSGTAPNLSYTPSAGFSGGDGFSFVANDGLMDSAPATIDITVTGTNQMPVAESQALTVSENSVLAVTLTGSDQDGDSLTFQVTSNPAHGALSGTAPNLSYTPTAGFSGGDGFSFVVNDGLLDSAPATVAINVTATGGGNQAISNYTNGITVDGDLSDWAQLVSFGADPDDISGAGNYLDWREGWMAHDDNNFYIAIRNDTAIELSWAYNVYLDTDGDSLTGFNDASVFPIGAEYLMQGGYLYQYIGDGSSWSWNFVATLTQAVNGQAAEFVIPRADIGNPNDLKLFFYGENAAYLSGAPLDLYPDQALDTEGTDRFFSYSTSTNTNHLPVADSQVLSVSENSVLAVTLTGSDSDGDALTFQVTSNPSHGTLSGTTPNLDYTPEAGFSGSDGFTFVANDGLLDSTPVTISITVTRTNQMPVADSQVLSVSENSILAVTLTGSDPDGDALTFQVTSNPSHGTLSGTAPNLDYTPEAGFSGSDGFSFVVNDGLLDSAPATVTINVTSTGGGGQGISNYTNGITVDGDLSDWAQLVSFGADPDDISGAGNYLDWREGWMAHDDNNFYIAVRNDTAIELSWAYNVYLDTDGDSATGFNDASAFPIGAEYLMQGGYLYQYTGDGSSWSWNFVATLSQAANGQIAEFVIARADIGNPNSLRLFFYGENVAYASGAPLDLYPDQALDSEGVTRFFEYYIP